MRTSSSIEPSRGESTSSSGGAASCHGRSSCAGTFSRTVSKKTAVNTGRPARKFFHAMLNRFFFDRHVSPVVNAFRADVGPGHPLDLSGTDAAGGIVVTGAGATAPADVFLLAA